jgi:hypothetical protein
MRNYTRWRRPLYVRSVFNRSGRPHRETISINIIGHVRAIAVEIIKRDRFVGDPTAARFAVYRSRGDLFLRRDDDNGTNLLAFYC